MSVKECEFVGKTKREIVWLCARERWVYLTFKQYGCNGMRETEMECAVCLCV